MALHSGRGALSLADPFSPSGEWLACSIARGDPDHEAGSVVVVPSDVSTSPQVIYHTEGGYAVAHGWVVVQRHTGEGTHWGLLLMRPDGGETRLLASDARFLGVLWTGEWCWTFASSSGLR